MTDVAYADDLLFQILSEQEDKRDADERLVKAKLRYGAISP